MKQFTIILIALCLALFTASTALAQGDSVPADSGNSTISDSDKPFFPPNDKSARLTKVTAAMHPAIMGSAFLVGLWTLFTGVRRFGSLHLGRNDPFAWQHHVLSGSLVLGVWLVGAISGAAATRILLGHVSATGLHYAVGLTMLPLILFGLGSGWYMHLHKKPRTVLPLVHGAVNTALMALAAWQAATGWPILARLVLD